MAESTQLTGPLLAAGSPGDSSSRFATQVVPTGTFMWSQDSLLVFGKAAAAIAVPLLSGVPVGFTTGYGALSVGDSDLNKFAGVAETAFASGEYGWVKVRGKVKAPCLSGVAAGDYVELSANNSGYLQKFTSGARVGIALAALAGASNGDIDIQLI